MLYDVSSVHLGCPNGRSQPSRWYAYDEEGTRKNCKRAADRAARRLEGSRFVAWQLYRLAAGGSRERLEVRQVLWAVVSPQQNRRAGSFPGAAC